MHPLAVMQKELAQVQVRVQPVRIANIANTVQKMVVLAGSANKYSILLGWFEHFSPSENNRENVWNIGSMVYFVGEYFCSMLPRKNQLINKKNNLKIQQKMIEKLSVDGFKSLRKFEIGFQKGLNVIIGPNGVGKTNICQALTILSSLTNNIINEAFTQFGGVRSTFNPVECDEQEKKIII